MMEINKKNIILPQKFFSELSYDDVFSLEANGRIMILVAIRLPDNNKKKYIVDLEYKELLEIKDEYFSKKVYIYDMKIDLSFAEKK